MLRKATNAKLKQMNSVYILEQKQVESSFLSEAQNYYLFGHMSNMNNKLSRMYLIWNRLVNCHLKDDPKLTQYNSSLTRSLNDFNFIHFEWSINLWRSYVLPPFELDENNLLYSIDMNLTRNNFNSIDPNQ